jgi:hypothetical protein
VAETRTVGRVLAAATTADDLLAEEAKVGLDRQFQRLEQLLTSSMARSCSGEPIVTYNFGDRGSPGTAAITGFTVEERGSVDSAYRLEVQETRGAWFLPEEATLAVGMGNVAYLASRTERFFWTATSDACVKVDFRASSDGLFLWAVLIPLFETLYAPFALRDATGKLKEHEDQVEAWDAAAAAYRDLGLRVDGAFAAMRLGGSWDRGTRSDHIDFRRQLLDEVTAQVSLDTARRWRARAAQRLTRAFYKKAERGTPLARQVITRALQKDLASVFAGDWLAFLRYLDEPVNSSEKVTTALPRTRLYVPGEGQVADVAAESGVAVDEVERIVAAYLGQERVVSPVAERVEVLKRWWPVFDEVHARQRSGMESLWGFVDDGVIDPVPGSIFEVRPKVGLFQRLIPGDLAVDIERFWDGMTLSRYPDRIVSNFHPYHQMANAFGPAVEFWDGVGLTCWFICEGPSSRTELQGLEHYYRRPLAELSEAGFPVDPSLFRELVAAEQTLGPPQQIPGRAIHYDIPGGTTTMEIGGGTRRDGFERLCNIVTQHRRAWAVNIDSYLQNQWDSQLREVGREFNRRLAARGKPPTLKQFASFATDAANNWFGGDLRALFTALGEPAPVQPERIDLLPGDPLAFVEDLFVRLGGKHLDPEITFKDVQLRLQEWTFSRLARDGLRYLQLWEALDRRPTLKEFGRPNVDWDTLGGEESGWEKYAEAIEAARSSTRTTMPIPATRPISESAPSGGLVPSPAPSAASNSPARWAKDPTGRFEYRYWDGTMWTEHVATRGIASVDPM